MVLEKGTEHILVALQKIAPMGDSVQIELRGYELTLRLDEAQKITVEQVHIKAEKPCHTKDNGSGTSGSR